MRRKLLLILFVILLLGSILVGAAYAQTGNGFDLHWNVIGGGGGVMTGSGFTITSTLGQTSVGSARGSRFEAGGGFWYLLAQLRRYLPITLKP
jgi:hypothetical protein